MSAITTFTHTVSNGFSNLYGYGIPDLTKALGLNISSAEKLEVSPYNNNTSLNALNTLEAWKAGFTGKGIKVGIFDRGAGLNTEAANLELPHATLFMGIVDPNDAHGFRVAQYIVAKNQMPKHVGGTGEKSETGAQDARDVTGVAFDAELYFADASVNVPQHTATKFQWFVDQGVDVINWSGSVNAGPAGLDHRNALRIAHENGVIVVIAAGNAGMGMDEGRTQDLLSYALEFDNIIVVSATRPNSPLPDALSGILHGYSNHAGDIRHNNFTVVEDASHAFFPSGDYESDINGTSFAAPYFVGVVALIIQKLRAEGKYDYSGDYLKVISLLKESASIPNTEPNTESNTDGIFWYLLSVVVDVDVLGPEAVILHNIREKVTISDGVTIDHTLYYDGNSYRYDEVDALIMTITRDGEFTNEFKSELVDYAPTANALSYNDLIGLVGVANVDNALLTIAGSDGFFVS